MAKLTTSEIYGDLTIHGSFVSDSNSLKFRDTSSLYYLSIVSDSTPTLTANKSLTIDIGDVSKILGMYADLYVGTSSNNGAITITSDSDTARSLTLEASTTIKPLTSGYVIYASASNTINTEQYLNVTRGGTGVGTFTSNAIITGNSTGSLLVPGTTLTSTELNASALTTVSISTTATSATTINIGTATTTGGTKAINIGTNGTTGSVTTIVIGTTGGTTPTITLNGAVSVATSLSLNANAGLTMASGTGTFSQTYTGTTTSASLVYADNVTTASGIRVSANALTSGSGISIYTAASAINSATISKGVYVERSGSYATGAHDARGVYSVVTATGTVTKYAGYFETTGTGTANYGIYASASGGTANYAGYFAGNVTLSGNSNLTMASGTGAFSQTYTGTTTDALSIVANSLTTANSISVTANALTSGSGISISTTASSINSATISKGIYISRSGSYATGAHDARGVYSVVTATGTVTKYAGYFETTGTGTANYGIYATASGGTANYGIYVNAGSVHLEPLTASYPLYLDANKNIATEQYLSVSRGGTGVGTFTANRIITGNGTSGLLNPGPEVTASALTFTNSANNSITANATDAGTAGRNLSVYAGSTSAGTANINGGGLYLYSGNSTGSGNTCVYIYTSPAGTAGATTLNGQLITAFFFRSTAGTGRLALLGTGGNNFLIIQPGSDLTANRYLTFTTGNADRTISLSGDLTLANNLTTSGNYAVTLTATNTTSITLPTSGTVAAYGTVPSANNLIYYDNAAGRLAADTSFTVSGNTLTSTVADGATAIGLVVNTPAYSTSGSKLLSVQNNTTEKFYVDYAGNTVITGSLTVSGTFTYSNAVTEKTFFAGPIAAPSAAPTWRVIADTDLPSALTGKTYNALTLTAASTGFTIAGGTTSKTLTVAATATINTNLTVQTGAVVLTGNASGSSQLTLPNANFTLNTSTSGYATYYSASGTLSGEQYLSVSRGGTGAGTFTAGRILFGNTTSALNTSANLFWDNSNSRLGIGTTSPTQSIQANGSIYSNGGHMYVNNTYGFVGNDGVNGLFPTSSTGGLTLKTASADRLKIDNAGNVGIGLTSPAEKLHTYGNIRIDDSSGNAGFKLSYNNTSQTLDFVWAGA